MINQWNHRKTNTGKMWFWLFFDELNPAYRIQSVFKLHVKTNYLPIHTSDYPSRRDTYPNVG